MDSEHEADQRNATDEVEDQVPGVQHDLVSEQEGQRVLGAALHVEVALRGEIHPDQPETDDVGHVSHEPGDAAGAL